MARETIPTGQFEFNLRIEDEAQYRALLSRMGEHKRQTGHAPVMTIVDLDTTRHIYPDFVKRAQAIGGPIYAYVAGGNGELARGRASFVAEQYRQKHGAMPAWWVQGTRDASWAGEIHLRLTSDLKMADGTSALDHYVQNVVLHQVDEAAAAGFNGLHLDNMGHKGFIDAQAQIYIATRVREHAAQKGYQGFGLSFQNFDDAFDGRPNELAKAREGLKGKVSAFVFENILGYPERVDRVQPLRDHALLLDAEYRYADASARAAYREGAAKGFHGIAVARNNSQLVEAQVNGFELDQRLTPRSDMPRGLQDLRPKAGNKMPPVGGIYVSEGGEFASPQYVAAYDSFREQTRAIIPKRRVDEEPAAGADREAVARLEAQRLREAEARAKAEQDRLAAEAAARAKAEVAAKRSYLKEAVALLDMDWLINGTRNDDLDGLKRDIAKIQTLGKEVGLTLEDPIQLTATSYVTSRDSRPLVTGTIASVKQAMGEDRHISPDEFKQILKTTYDRIKSGVTGGGKDVGYDPVAAALVQRDLDQFRGEVGAALARK